MTATDDRRPVDLDPWHAFLNSTDRLRLTARIPTFPPRENLVIHPSERPRIEKNDLTDRWHVIYHRPVGRTSLAETESFPTWSRAMLAAIWDVNQRLADWVSTHDGLTDYEDPVEPAEPLPQSTVETLRRDETS